MPNKHLIVDAQLLQTSDRNRGMGLYLRSLLDNLVGKNISMTWLVNDRLANLIDEDIKLLDTLSANVLRVGLLHKGDNELFADSENKNIAKVDKSIINTLKDYDEVTYFIPALFSSEIHPVFPSQGTKNIVLFHDLIPFLYHKNYFADHNGALRKDYSQRFRQFYKSDIVVTNSQTTADDLTVYFGVDMSRIVPVLGAAADRSNIKPQKPKVVKDKFILMPSGDDFRKNNILAAQAFSALDTDYKLVVTSRFSDATKNDLKTISKDIIFTDSVSDSEFLWLLDNAEVVFFPPEYEGLGMPLLEAVQRNATIACSNIPVFAEISRKAFFYFDPKSVNDMTRVLKEAIKADKQKHTKAVKDEYLRILRTFNWAMVADSFVESLDMTTTKITKKKLAVFCPSPSSYSAVGKYAFEIHAELSRYFDIDYYVENGITAFDATRPNILDGAANYYLANDFNINEAQQYDQVLYHIGNSEFHADTILSSLRLPANAIIHDTKLKGIFNWLQNRGIITADRRELESKLDILYGTENTTDLTSIVTNQKLLLAHSTYAKEALSSKYDVSIKQTIHPMGVPEIQPKNAGMPVVSFAGIISEDKGINIVSDIAKNKDIRVNVFGFGVIGDSPLLKNLGDNVSISKDLTDKEFQDMLKRTDILVNYRPNYHGETSRTTLEAMRHGCVVIVKDIGWYAELPDNTVMKVESELKVLSTIEKLLSSKSDMQKISQAAQEFLKKEYSYRKYADYLYKNLV